MELTDESWISTQYSVRILWTVGYASSTTHVKENNQQDTVMTSMKIQF